MLRSRIFQVDPYEDFHADLYEEDCQGWNSDHPVFGKAIQYVKPRLIVEVGSWKGRSAINMARICKSLGLQTEILCVDTWLGSPEHWGIKDANHFDSLRLKNGYPQLYYTFMKNVVAAGMTEIITPAPLPSQLAAIGLSAFEAVAELIYIDGAHDYHSVMADLESYAPLLSVDGVMLMDDYGSYDDTTQAIEAFAKKNNWHLSAERQGKAILSRNTLPAELIFPGEL